MPSESNRPRRVAELLKRELAQLIRAELDDPRIGDVTLTAVAMAPDLKSAKVYFTRMGPPGEIAEAAAVLNRASGYLRHCLRGRVDLRGIPALRFIYDQSVDRGARVSALIDRALAAEPDSDTKRDTKK